MSFDKAIDNLQKRVTVLEEEKKFHQNIINSQADINANLNKEILILKSALEFYADINNYMYNAMTDEKGDRARGALLKCL